MQEAFVVDDADHDEVQVDALDAHPGEHGQEEVVQQAGDNRAEELRRRRKNGEKTFLLLSCRFRDDTRARTRWGQVTRLGIPGSPCARSC